MTQFCNVTRTARSFGMILAIAIALGSCRAVSAPPPDEVAPAAEAAALVRSVRLISGTGGRLDWYRGAGHDLIAYDALVDLQTRDTEVFTMRPDGSAVRCVTCGAAVPKGFVGQPAWHPDGEHLIVQAEGEHSSHRLFNHMSWGINADLWIVSRDGRRAERIWRSPENHGALHPHFDASGRHLVFAERVATGRVIGGRRARGLGAGGENPWTGWRIHIADVDLSRRGEAILSNHRVLFESRPGLYETHEFAGDGRIVFSHTAGGRPYVDDIYIANANGSNMRALVSSPGIWDEHGSFPPSDDNVLAFVSSRVDPGWRFPGSDARTLRTELFLRTAGGRVTRITDFNRQRDSGFRYLTSDYSWGRDGRRIAVQVAPVANRSGAPASPEIWMITFASRQ